MKKMTTIEILENALAKYGITTVFYFDRIKIYCDAHNHEATLNILVNDNRKNKFNWSPLTHNAFYDRMIDLFQPSTKCFDNLIDQNIMSGDYAITYIEFALDFMSDDKQTFTNLVSFLNRHLVHIPSKRSKDKPYYYGGFKEATYFSAGNDKERFVLYTDKPARKSKIKYCLHIELRIEGWSLVKNKSIVTIDDLINFNHRQLWNNLLDFRRSIQTTLGELCQNRKISRQANYKRGIKECENIKFLQKYLTEHFERESAFVKIKPENLDKFLDSIMSADVTIL